MWLSCVWFHPPLSSYSPQSLRFMTAFCVSLPAARVGHLEQRGLFEGWPDMKMTKLPWTADCCQHSCHPRFLWWRISKERLYYSTRTEWICARRSYLHCDGYCLFVCHWSLGRLKGGDLGSMSIGARDFQRTIASRPSSRDWQKARLIYQ